MRETDVIERIRHMARGSSKLVQGIGDDCAILRPRPGEDLVFTTDFLLENRHFERATHTPAQIGHKALARSLSDLAAMGAEPVFCLVSLAIPAGIDSRWINSFYRGLLALAGEHKLMLAGGDLAKFDLIAADVMCCGRVPSGQAMLRSAAQPGDRIYVTGELGASALGFSTRRGPAWRRHLQPQPRVLEGIKLRRRGVRACMDLSDGLSLDLHRLCLASKVSADLNNGLPVARGAALQQALHGGEDYELLFTAAPSVAVPKRFFRIGTIVRGRPGLVRFDGKKLPVGGFDHFAKRATSGSQPGEVKRSRSASGRA